MFPQSFVSLCFGSGSNWHCTFRISGSFVQSCLELGGSTLNHPSLHTRFIREHIGTSQTEVTVLRAAVLTENFKHAILSRKLRSDNSKPSKRHFTLRLCRIHCKDVTFSFKEKGLELQAFVSSNPFATGPVLTMWRGGKVLVGEENLSFLSLKGRRVAPRS